MTEGLGIGYEQSARMVTTFLSLTMIAKFLALMMTKNGSMTDEF